MRGPTLLKPCKVKSPTFLQNANGNNRTRCSATDNRTGKYRGPSANLKALPQSMCGAVSEETSPDLPIIPIRNRQNQLARRPPSHGVQNTSQQSAPFSASSPGNRKRIIEMTWERAESQTDWILSWVKGRSSMLHLVKTIYTALPSSSRRHTQFRNSAFLQAFTAQCHEDLYQKLRHRNSSSSSSEYLKMNNQRF